MTRTRKKEPAAEDKRGQVELTEDEKQMVEMSLRTLPPDLRTRSVANMLGTTLRVPELADRLHADPRRYFEECGFDLPPEVTIEVHRYARDRIHLVLPAPELLPLGSKRRGKVELTDDDLISGIAFTRLKSDKKRDGNDGKQRPDADDVRDTGWFSGTDDAGDGSDFGDRRRRVDKD